MSREDRRKPFFRSVIRLFLLDRRAADGLARFERPWRLTTAIASAVAVFVFVWLTVWSFRDDRWAMGLLSGAVALVAIAVLVSAGYRRFMEHRADRRAIEHPSS